MQMFCEWKVYNKHNMFVINFLPTKHYIHKHIVKFSTKMELLNSCRNMTISVRTR